MKLQMLSVAKADLLLRAVINSDDLKRNPDVITEHLSENLREYYAALKRLGRSINDVSAECSRCRLEPVGNRPVGPAEKTEMTQCSRGDLG